MTKRWLMLSLFFIAAGNLLAADWPQWRGEHRDARSPEKGLLQAWPEKGPPLAWTFTNAGLGFSSFSVVGDRLYTMGARNEETYVIAIDVAKGQELWSTKVDKIFTFRLNQWGDGPRSTPTIDGDRLYALTGNGALVCLNTSDGKELWRTDLVKDLGGEMMTEWGYSESVLIDGDNLICTPGGKNGTLAALDKKSGKVKWRSKEATFKAPYSSIVAAKIGGVHQYIQAGYIDSDGKQGGVLMGVAAENGKLLWTGTLLKSSSFAIAPTPIVKENFVYMTVGESAGCHLFEVTAEGGAFTATDKYSTKSKKAVSNDHGGMVLVGDFLYGHAGNRGWVCQEFATGDIKWNERFELPGKSGAVIYANSNLYIQDEDGTVALIKANPEQFEIVGKFELPNRSKLAQGRQSSVSARAWTHPVVANGRLYVRDQEFIFSYDVKGK